jgi:hypothetical protein
VRSVDRRAELVADGFRLWASGLGFHQIAATDCEDEALDIFAGIEQPVLA